MIRATHGQYRYCQTLQQQLTAQRLEILKQGFDLIGIDITNVRHEIRNLERVSAVCNAVEGLLGTHFALAVRHLLVHVVIAQDLVDCGLVSKRRGMS